MHKHKPWICDECENRYFRVNKLRVWTTTSPGKRHGWDFEERYLCTKCMDGKQAQHIVRVATVRLVKKTA